MAIILIKLADNLWLIEKGSINVCTEFELDMLNGYQNNWFGPVVL